jgi:glycosyltransferase involved in cell wall biosynthesis
MHNGRIKVAHLITGLETGGAERMLAQLAARIDSGKFETLVVSMTGVGPMAAAIEAAGVPVETLRLTRGTPDPRALPRLVRVLRRFRPHILQTWLYHADLLGSAVRLLGVAPHLLWNIRCSEMVDAARLPRILARCARLPDAIVVNSAAGQTFHSSLGYRPRCWTVLPNGFDTQILRPSPEERARRRAGFGWDEATVVIALPARYHPMKDHATFLAAAARLALRLPNTRFVLIGSGCNRENPELARLTAAHGLAERLVLLGERADLYRLYPAFDVVTLCSAYGEGFPNVLGEAMSCGVPCVATAVGDSPAIIADTGKVVPPRDPEALAAAWEELAQLDATSRIARGARARAQIVEKFSLAPIVARYEALYDKVARG